jgi:hypothetical protein
MTSNVRSELIDMPEPRDPNYKAITSSQQKIYPQSNIITGTNIAGDLNIIFNVPAGHKLDVSRSYLVFDVAAVVAAGTVLVTTTVAPNVCSTFFSTGRLMLNDVLTSQSSNVAQDDTLFKRITNSRNKLKSISPEYWGNETSRVASWATVLRQKLMWRPDVLLNPDQIIPENVKCHLQLQVHPNLHTVASSPAFIARTNAASDGTLRFYEIYMMATFIKVDVSIPKTVFIPSYTIRSSYQDVSTVTSANLQFQVPKETFKLAVVLQSGAATVTTGLVSTKFSSGEVPDAAPLTRQNTYSAYLQNLQIRHAGRTYPSAQYNLIETAARTGSIEAYADFISNTDGTLDPSGSESYVQWSDPTLAGDEGLGRIFLFSIVKPSNDTDGSCEVTVSFTNAPTSTRVWLFSISKSAYGIQYGDNKQIEDVKVVPYM